MCADVAGVQPCRAASALLAAATVGILMPVATAQAGADAPTPVVVEFDPASSDATRAEDLRARGLELVDMSSGSDFALALPVSPPTTDPAGSIEAVDPVVTHHAFALPDDPAYRYQWHLAAIDAVGAWGVSDGAGAVVAVLDTGVAYVDRDGFPQAPDLAGTGFVPGWDFVDGDAYPQDRNGHGTHVASTIAATTGNGLGVAGVAPGAAIMPLRVLDGEGSGTDWDIAEAIRFAADHGADVVNLSLGSDRRSSVIADAVDYAHGRGLTVVAASGNDGVDRVSYPAALDHVISVGAVRYDSTRPSYANYGAGLDVVAPGGDTNVDQNRDGQRDGILQESFTTSPSAFCYCFLQGTSMAAPQVSAVAAMLSARGVSDPDVVEQLLVSTARDLGQAGRDDQYGHGLLQAGAALRAPIPSSPSVPVSTDAPAVAVRGIGNACPDALTPTSVFVDLLGSVHADAVACAAWWGVASGRTAERFDPAGNMTRAQLASFVGRMLAASGVQFPSAPDAFVDDEGSVHETAINELAALGVVRGRTATTYAPSAIVTRAEMATFLVRAHDVVAATPLAAGSDRFTDDESSTHEVNIDKVAAAGLAGGTSPTTFAPTAPVARGQMASFLARTLDLFVATGEVSLP